MQHLLPQYLLPIAVVVAVVVVAVAGRLIRRHRAPASIAESPACPSSLVRVLTSDEELRDAVHRAADFERMVADTVRTRARRYEAMVAEIPIADIGIGRRRSVQAPGDEASRSA